jgi:peptidoglycan hydrolase CwlO-like protein
VPSELQAQLTSINKKLDEVKNTFVDLSEKLSTKVGQLEDRVVNMEKSIDVIFSRINYARDMAKIKHMYTKKSIETVLLPVITDIGKTIAGISRSQVSKKEIETICNDAQDALNDLDEEKDKAINGLESKYPLLKFR